jgi:four helix bundle protein
MERDRPFDLSERLDVFAARIVRYVDRMPSSISGQYFSGQLLRSGASPALHYGESQSAESRADLIHKCRIGHKELKESRSNLNIQFLSELMPRTDPDLIWLRQECEELIRILGKIISNSQAKI